MLNIHQDSKEREPNMADIIRDLCVLAASIIPVIFIWKALAYVKNNCESIDSHDYRLFLPGALQQLIMVYLMLHLH